MKNVVILSCYRTPPDVRLIHLQIFVASVDVFLQQNKIYLFNCVYPLCSDNYSMDTQRLKRAEKYIKVMGILSHNHY